MKQVIIKQRRNAVGYVRVSTAEQAENGRSLEEQHARIVGWCVSRGCAPDGIFVDAGISGTRTDRPELAKALDACRPGTAFIVYSLSRLGRSTRHVLEVGERLERIGADLISLSENIDTTSASGKMIFRMLAVLAEFERDVISERIRDTLQGMKAKGEFIGTVPYGMRLAPDGVHLLPHPAEHAVIKRVQRLHARGLSLRKIAAKLTEEGHKPRGEMWYAQTVKNLLANATQVSK